MIVLGFDTATPATAVALGGLPDGFAEARDDPRPGERPGHTTRLLALAEGLLARAGIAWEALERIAVGTGPGTFTGLRIGVATAQGLSSSLSIELVGYRRSRRSPTPRSQARSPLPPADGGRRRSAAPPARACWRCSTRAAGRPSSPPTRRRTSGLRRLLAPRAVSPGELPLVLAEADSARETLAGDWLAVGDGAVRFRELLERLAAGCRSDASPCTWSAAGPSASSARRAPAGVRRDRAARLR